MCRGRFSNTRKYKNIKTNEIYNMLCFSINKSDCEDTKCVIYESKDKEVYCMNLEKFAEEFVPYFEQ